MAETFAMTPVPYRVRSRVAENADSVTLTLDPIDTVLPLALPGEFMMMHAFGVGEIAISTSGISPDGTLTHTIRAVGAVSAPLESKVSVIGAGLAGSVPSCLSPTKV